MKIGILSLLIAGLSSLIYAQEPTLRPTDQLAKVWLQFTDVDGAPLRDELLLFRGQNTDYQDSCITNFKGQCRFLIPEGDNYWIEIQGVRADSQYHELVVPSMPGPQEIDVLLTYAPPPFIVLERVYFDTDKAVLRPESYPELNRLVHYLKRKKDLRAEIQGHTDNQGSAEHNAALSRDRALAVLRYLIGQGIDFRRLSAKGYGADQPAVPNDTPANRQRNRRVEVHFSSSF